MMVERAQYTSIGNIRATIDGTEHFVPDNMDNPHRQMIAEWEAEGNTIAPYVEPPAPLVYPQFTALQMLDLFTEAEQLAVVEATMSVPAVKLWYDRMIAATFVTYEDPRTEGGLQALVDAELITAQRKADIVAAMQPA